MKANFLSPFIRVLMLFVPLICTALITDSAYAAEPVRIGVLAFRPKPQTLAQWQPLAIALKQAIPERDFVVEALTYPELDAAVASRQLDFVFTNSGHYLLLSKRNGLSAPLATLASKENGQRVSVMGGVIFTRAGQANIDSLADLRGKVVAATSLEAFGGYQMQVYELSVKKALAAKDLKMIMTGMPHDNVVNAVLSGKAEAGFVRTGVIEQMVREHKLDISQIKVINRQNLPNFPLIVSTRLYPDWPFAALPHIDENLSRHVAAALFSIEENQAATQAMGIHGFIIPADYSPVSDLLRELRLPPFEAAPTFSLKEAIERFRWQMSSAAVAFGLIIFLGFGLLLSKRKLASQHRSLQSQEEQVRQLAFYDALTKLPNRRLLNDRLSHTMAASKRSACYAALMFIDLDNFKPLNDEHGHAVGDLLLIEVADRLKSCVREVDTVARFGGDEFVVMLSELDSDKTESITQAKIVAEKILTALAEPYMLNIKQAGRSDAVVKHLCTASIGVVVFINHDGNPDDIVKWADVAMYQAKEAGRNLIRFYDSKV